MQPNNRHVPIVRQAVFILYLTRFPMRLFLLFNIQTYKNQTIIRYSHPKVVVLRCFKIRHIPENNQDKRDKVLFFTVFNANTRTIAIKKSCRLSVQPDNLQLLTRLQRCLHVHSTANMDCLTCHISRQIRS